MKKTQKKRNKKRSSLVLLVGFSAFLCYFAIVIIGQQSELKSAKNEKDALQTQLTEQLLENEEISNLLTNGEEEYIKRIAREQLGYVMPEERVFYDISGN